MGAPAKRGPCLPFFENLPKGILPYSDPKGPKSAQKEPLFENFGQIFEKECPNNAMKIDFKKILGMTNVVKLSVL